MGSLPVEIGGITVSEVYQGWKLVVIFAQKPARDLSEEVHQRIKQGRHALAEVLPQA